MITSRTDIAPSDDEVAILYENDAWLGELLDALGAGGVPYRALRMDDAAARWHDPPAHRVVFNRVSPSSHLRGHGPAIAYARALLGRLESRGRRVINGSRSFALETSKAAQLVLLEHLGMATPATVLFNGRRAVLDVARGFPFPAILKPDCGGSGALVRRIECVEDLESRLRRERDLFGPDHLLLLQEQVVADGEPVVRLEFIDGELVYAMRVRATNTFNLCPAEACERPRADPQDASAPRVAFEAYPDVPAEAVAEGRRIVRAAGLGVGGVEYVERAGGRVYFDINATSVYRADVAETLGVDPGAMLAGFVKTLSAERGQPSGLTSRRQASAR